MAGNYRARQSSSRTAHKARQWFLMCVVFVGGYMSASLYDFSQFRTFISEHGFKNNSTPVLAKIDTKTVALPKPKFEFYTLLANEQVAGSSPSPALPEASQAVKAPPVPTPTLTPTHSQALALVDAVSSVSHSNPGKSKPSIINHGVSYMVQVASFKTMQDAERMKVMLVMKGLDVKITVASQQGINWYRVVMGPFASKIQAQDAQGRFARQEHINGMIRRMDA